MEQVSSVRSSLRDPLSLMAVELSVLYARQDYETGLEKCSLLKSDSEQEAWR